MATKLEQFLFYFLFFAIPLQTRKILYSSGWYYNEWQSISFYLTDLILLALFGFWVFHYFRTRKILNSKLETLNKLKIQNPKLKIYDYFLLGFLVVVGISVKNSSDFYVGAFLWLKLVEFALFYFYLKNYAIKKFNFVKILCALIIGGVFQAIIAIGQFWKQGDLGLRWLGESVLGLHMTGIASFYTFVGDKVIRAYGTTPHPNVLAAYLFLSIFAFCFVFIYQKRNNNHKHYDAMAYHSGGRFYDTMIYHKILKYWWVVVYSLLLFGLFFTFSRTVIFLWGVGFLIIVATIVMSIRKGSKIPVDKRLAKSFIHRLVSLVLVTFIVVGAFSFLYWSEVQSRMILSSEEEAVRLRVFYNKESLGGGINLFGIGLGGFTGWLMEQNPNLPSYMYQPVHNIYLLMYKEIGIIGFVLFLLFLAGLFYEFIKKTRLRKLKYYSFLLVVASVLFIGLFDHFLLTLQQGRFLLWISLALLTYYNKYDTV